LVPEIVGCGLSARLLRVDGKIVDGTLIDAKSSSANCKPKSDELVTLLKEKMKREARKPLYLLRYE
jgi:hypothetical protein